jgi:predicted nucleotidyltransferase component of viral defense system
MAETQDINALPHLHQDPEEFRAAIAYTSRTTQFNAALIEKDYYCSVILAYLYQESVESLIFKGGTCINKIHIPFYRLSEDLDFTIPTSPNATRLQRRKSIDPYREILARIGKCIPTLSITTPFRGHNESRQYIMAVEYESCLINEPGQIKIEMGLREILLQDAFSGSAKTVLQNPFTLQDAVPDFFVICLSKTEAFAEKVRAALARREPAIRDFFDIFHAVRHHRLNIEEKQFLELVKEKLAVPGTGSIDISENRLADLNHQLAGELKPVLRPEDYEAFDLEDAIRMVCQIGVELTRFESDSN